MTERIRLVDSAKYKEALKGTKPTSDLGLRKSGVHPVKAVGDRTLEFVISTGAVDRDRDIISQKGWELANFLANPVVLFAHQHSQPPVAMALNTRVSKGKLVSQAQFMPADMSPFANSIFRMYAEGFMRATSVGFRALKVEFTEDEDRLGGLDFETQELLEFSMVPVPANPEALIQAHAGGIEMGPLREWASEILDDGSLQAKELVSATYERAWKAISDAPIIVDLGATGSIQLTLPPDDDDDADGDANAAVEPEQTAAPDASHSCERCGGPTNDAGRYTLSAELDMLVEASKKLAGVAPQKATAPVDDLIDLDTSDLEAAYGSDDELEFDDPDPGGVDDQMILSALSKITQRALAGALGSDS